MELFFIMMMLVGLSLRLDSLESYKKDPNAKEHWSNDDWALYYGADPSWMYAEEYSN